MKIIIKKTKITLTPALVNFLKVKLAKVEKFLPDNLKKELPTELFVELGKPSLHHLKGDVFYAELQLTLPGKVLLRAKSKQSDLRKAILEAQEKIIRQLEKYKEKNLENKNKEQKNTEGNFEK